MRLFATKRKFLSCFSSKLGVTRMIQVELEGIRIQKESDHLSKNLRSEAMSFELTLFEFLSRTYPPPQEKT